MGSAIKITHEQTERVRFKFSKKLFYGWKTKMNYKDGHESLSYMQRHQFLFTFFRMTFHLDLSHPVSLGWDWDLGLDQLRTVLDHSRSWPGVPSMEYSIAQMVDLAGWALIGQFKQTCAMTHPQA